MLTAGLASLATTFQVSVEVEVKCYERNPFSTITVMKSPVLEDGEVSILDETKVDERDLALALRLIRLRDIESNPGPTSSVSLDNGLAH